MNAFSCDWSKDNNRLFAQYLAIEGVWRTLRAQGARATMFIPVWESATCWHLVAPDMVHLYDEVIDWVWLPRADPAFFIHGAAPGRQFVPPDWQVMAVRLDFSSPHG